MWVIERKVDVLRKAQSSMKKIKMKDGLIRSQSTAIIAAAVRKLPVTRLVAPEFQKNRIGKLLVVEVEKLAKHLGFQTLFLFTTVPNQHLWYEKLGWQLFATDVYQNQVVHIMIRTQI